MYEPSPPSTAPTHVGKRAGRPWCGSSWSNPAATSHAIRYRIAQKHPVRSLWSQSGAARERGGWKRHTTAEEAGREQGAGSGVSCKAAWHLAPAYIPRASHLRRAAQRSRRPTEETTINIFPSLYINTSIIFATHTLTHTSTQATPHPHLPFRQRALLRRRPPRGSLQPHRRAAAISAITAWLQLVDNHPSAPAPKRAAATRRPAAGGAPRLGRQVGRACGGACGEAVQRSGRRAIARKRAPPRHHPMGTPRRCLRGASSQQPGGRLLLAHCCVAVRVPIALAWHLCPVLRDPLSDGALRPP